MLVWNAHKVKVRSLAFSLDGRFIATTAGQSKFVWLWEATSGQLVRKFSRGLLAARVAAFHPDGRHLVAINESHGGCMWDIESGRIVAILEMTTWQYSDTLAVSPTDGRVVFHISSGLSEWDEPTRPSEQPRRCDRTRPLPAKIMFYPLRLAYSPTGKYFCLLERILYLLDPVTHRELHLLVDHGGANASAVAFTPDESRVAVAFGHRAAVWQMGRPQSKPVSLRGHSLLVRAVGFLPGGDAVLTAAMDGTARIWNANNGAELRAFDWGIGKVRVAAVSPDGLTCAAGGEHGQVVVWDVDV